MTCGLSTLGTAFLGLMQMLVLMPMEVRRRLREDTRGWAYAIFILVFVIVVLIIIIFFLLGWILGD